MGATVNNYVHAERRVIAVSSQKGGVGKSTTAINVAAYLGTYGYKTILIDIDPQCNSTSGVGIDYNIIGDSICDVLVSGRNPNDLIVNTPFKNLMILPSKWELSSAEADLHHFIGKEFRLKEAIAKIEKNYDFIIIDCSASLSLLTINALSACRELIIPMQCEFYALEGISRFLETIDFIKNRYNYFLDITGIVITMYNKTRLANQVIKEINRYFPDKVFNTIIPKNISLAEAPAAGKPIGEYDPYCKGALAYNDLTKEIIEINLRIDKREFSFRTGSFADFWHITKSPKHIIKKN